MRVKAAAVNLSVQLVQGVTVVIETTWKNLLRSLLPTSGHAYEVSGKVNVLIVWSE